MNKKTLKAVMFLFAAVFLISTGKLAFEFIDRKKSEKMFDEVASLVVPEQVTEKIITITPQDKYGAVYRQNDDFVGWLCIDNTKINYPVMQTPQEREYYLRRGFDKKYSYNGVPFMEGRCKIGHSDNLIIYAHNMTDGSMFSDLVKYTDKAFYEDHKYINFDTLDSFGKYQIIAVFKTVVYTENDFEYYNFIYADNKYHFNNFVADCKARSLYSIDTPAEFGDRLITLSTCDYGRDNGRLVVVAKLVEESRTLTVKG